MGSAPLGARLRAPLRFRTAQRTAAEMYARQDRPRASFGVVLLLQLTHSAVAGAVIGLGCSCVLSVFCLLQFSRRIKQSVSAISEVCQSRRVVALGLKPLKSAVCSKF